MVRKYDRDQYPDGPGAVRPRSPGNHGPNSSIDLHRARRHVKCVLGRVTVLGLCFLVACQMFVFFADVAPGWARVLVSSFLLCSQVIRLIGKRWHSPGNVGTHRETLALTGKRWHSPANVGTHQETLALTGKRCPARVLS